MSKKTTRTPFKLAVERDSEESKSHEMFTEVGRAVVQLSNIENELANLYHSLAVEHYSGTPIAMAVFFAQSWFEGKILLVDLLMRIAAPKEFFGRWEKIVKELMRTLSLDALSYFERQARGCTLTLRGIIAPSTRILET
jgi:hypothetical protein